MQEKLSGEDAVAGSASLAQQRRLCLEHAGDLIASAERVLAKDGRYANIVYHLAILAMEEIGKAAMLSARAVTKGALDPNWIDRRMDDHVQKLMWAVWSPGMRAGKIDPKDFEEARQFAESTHRRRMAGLYVDHADNSALEAPREVVRTEHATSLLNLAKARLEMEAAEGDPIPDENREELDWFLATVSSDEGRKKLFSRLFIQKHEEFRGDTRKWVRWAREEFSRIVEEEREHLQRELSRQASRPGNAKPKWLMKVRVQTPSHSLRQKTLNYWNERMDAVKLRAVGSKNDDLLLEMTINDHVTIGQLFDFGLSLTKLHIAMLNIGTAGFFWYELAGQARAYFESIQDLDDPKMYPSIARVSGLSKEWSEDRPDGRRRQRVALQETHLNIAMMGVAVYGSMPDEEAGPIFGPYLHGLMLLSKNDLHLSVENQARDAFLKALRKAMCHFGDLPSEDTVLLPALHRVFVPIIPQEAHRKQIFDRLGDADGTTTLADAVSAKRVTDLYLGLVVRRLWPEFVKAASEKMRGDSEQRTTS